MSLDYASLLPTRDSAAHKGQVGRIGIIAGSTQLLGAALLAAKASLRTGAGLVYVMTVGSAAGSLNAQVPELIVVPLAENQGKIDESAISQIVSAIATHHIDSLAIGPGLGRHPKTQRLVQTLLSRPERQAIPTVWDADALFACRIQDFRDAGQNQVLTPHPKEFERLVGGPMPETPEARKQQAEDAAKSAKSSIVLKGAASVISDGNRTTINPNGNAGMATAGMGDVLSGVIATLMGQGRSAIDAATLGAYLHGLAGDLVYKDKGNSLIASDVIDTLPEAIRQCSAS